MAVVRIRGSEKMKVKRKLLKQGRGFVSFTLISYSSTQRYNIVLGGVTGWNNVVVYLEGISVRIPQCSNIFLNKVFPKQDDF